MATAHSVSESTNSIVRFIARSAITILTILWRRDSLFRALGASLQSPLSDLEIPLRVQQASQVDGGLPHRADE
jgi:hypothetical protein